MSVFDDDFFTAQDTFNDSIQGDPFASSPPDGQPTQDEQEPFQSFKNQATQEEQTQANDAGISTDFDFAIPSAVPKGRPSNERASVGPATGSRERPMEHSAVPKSDPRIRSSSVGRIPIRESVHSAAPLLDEVALKSRVDHVMSRLFSEKRSYLNKIDSLEREADIHKSTIARLRDSVLQSEKEKEDMRIKLERAERDNDDVCGRIKIIHVIQNNIRGQICQITNMESQFDKLAETYQLKYNQVVLQMEKMSQDYAMKFVNLSVTLRDEKSKIQSLEEELSSTQAQLKEKNLELDKLSKELDSVRLNHEDEINALKEEKKAEAVAFDEKIREIEENKVLLDSQVESLNATIEGLDFAKKKLESVVADLEKKVVEDEQEIEEYKIKIEEVSLEKEQIERNYLELEVDNKNLNEELEVKSREIVNLSKELEMSEEASSEQLADLNNRIEGLKKEVEEAQTLQSRMKEELEGKEKTIQELTHEIDFSKDKFNETISDMEKEKLEAEEQVSVLSSRKSELEKQVITMESEMNILKEQLEILQRRIEEDESKIQEIKSKIIYVQERREHENKVYQLALEQARREEQDIRQKEKENDVLKNDLTNLEKMISDLKYQFEQQQKETTSQRGPPLTPTMHKSPVAPRRKISFNTSSTLAVSKKKPSLSPTKTRERVSKKAKGESLPKTTIPKKKEELSVTDLYARFASPSTAAGDSGIARRGRRVQLPLGAEGNRQSSSASSSSEEDVVSADATGPTASSPKCSGSTRYVKNPLPKVFAPALKAALVKKQITTDDSDDSWF